MKRITHVSALILLICLIFQPILFVDASQDFYILRQATPTTEIYRSATPVHDWDQAPMLSPSVGTNQPTRSPDLDSPPDLLSAPDVSPTPEPTVTESLPTFTPTLPAPTPTRSTLGEARTLVSSNRYREANYLAIFIGFLTGFLLIAALAFLISKRK